MQFKWLFSEFVCLGPRSQNSTSSKWNRTVYHARKIISFNKRVWNLSINIQKCRYSETLRYGFKEIEKILIWEISRKKSLCDVNELNIYITIRYVIRGLDSNERFIFLVNLTDLQHEGLFMLHDPFPSCNSCKCFVYISTLKWK